MEVGVFIPDQRETMVSCCRKTRRSTSQLRAQQGDHPQGREIRLRFHVLSMIKLRESWQQDRVLGSQSQILHADVGTGRRHHAHPAPTPPPATLVMPPAIVARMAPTIDSISNGRFSLNLVTGWQRRNIRRWACGRATSIFPGATIISANMPPCCVNSEAGRSDLKGEFFQMDDCRLSPRPQADTSEGHLRRFVECRHGILPRDMPTTISASASASIRPRPSRPPPNA